MTLWVLAYYKSLYKLDLLMHAEILEILSYQLVANTHPDYCKTFVLECDCTQLDTEEMLATLLSSNDTMPSFQGIDID